MGTGTDEFFCKDKKEHICKETENDKRSEMKIGNWSNTLFQYYSIPIYIENWIKSGILYIKVTCIMLNIFTIH